MNRIKNKVFALIEPSDLIVAVLALFLIIYTGLRAARVPFVLDESFSFNTFLNLSYKDIVKYSYPSANNHMINTLCMKFISSTLGNSEFLLRLPSLFSHIVYMIFTYKILKKNTSSFLVIAGFILLNFNPFLLEFFALARGYGMAISFITASAYYLLNYFEKGKIKSIILCLIFSMLATLASFTCLIYYVSVIAIINVFWIASISKPKFTGLVQKNIPVLISCFFLFVILFRPIRRLIAYHEFYDGGMTGFWTDTVGSLIYSTLYGRPYQHISTIIFQYFIGISYSLMLVNLGFKFYYNRWKALTDKFTVLFLLLTIPCLVTMLQHYLTESLFPINRMALFFVPLFFLAVILLINDLHKSNILKAIGRTVLSVTACALMLHSITSLNTSYTMIWKYDSNTRQALADLEKQVKQGNKTPIKLGIVWLFEPSVNFYRTTKKYTWLEPVTRDSYRNSNYDYYFIADSSMDFIKNRKLSILKHYTPSDTYLAK